MSDFFMDKNEEQVISQEQQATQDVPRDYIKIKLSSLGKLSAPFTVHIRDYNGKDLLDLGLTPDEDMGRALVQVLNNILWEDIDARDLHERELEEIMLNIYVNFWSPVIQGYPFPYTKEEWDSIDDERKERINKGLEKLEIDINVAEKVTTTPIKENFKEPIVVTDKDTKNKVGFILPRMGHYFIAEDYIEEVYSSEDQKFSEIDEKVRHNNSAQTQSEKYPIDTHDLREYRDYIKRRNSDYVLVKQAQMIHSFNGNVVNTIAEKLDIYPKISLKLWKALNTYIEDTLSFGVDRNIEMTSPIDGTTVTRRCLFRPVDFLPPDDIQDSGEYTFQFGNE